MASRNSGSAAHDREVGLESPETFPDVYIPYSY